MSIGSGLGEVFRRAESLELLFGHGPKILRFIILVEIPQHTGGKAAAPLPAESD